MLFRSHTTNWVEFHTIKQDVLLKISDIITRHGAEIAFPTSTLHLAGSPQFSGEALHHPQNSNELKK